MYKRPIQFKHLFFEVNDNFDRGLRFVDLVVISTKRRPHQKAVPVLHKMAVSEFTECINVQFNLSIFSSKLMTILIEVFVL